jgi:hypothetical protein
MQRMAQRSERRLVEGFAQRRMRVDGERDVFEAHAHFHPRAKAGRKVGHSNSLNGVNQPMSGLYGVSSTFPMLLRS